MTVPPIDDDAAWEHWRAQWQIRADTVYLNHGSFGPPPEPVRAARRGWIDQLDQQPMDFLVRHRGEELHSARAALADFVGTQKQNLVFMENATAAMNVVADSFPLKPGDEVVLTNHEYDAVSRIWQRRCERAGAKPPVVADLPLPLESAEQILEAIFGAVGESTRLIVVSHITSATALILPVEEICRRASDRDIAVCIDGPHAPAQVPLDIDSLGCDFYTASCHKWLCAPFGSGFLFVHPKHQPNIRPQALSWGCIPPETPSRWDDEFSWTGTRDPSAYLTVPAAIDFMKSAGLEAFRQRTHHLTSYARSRLGELPGCQAITPDDLHGSMTLVELPAGDNFALQQELWKRFGIEVPIIAFEGRRLIRVSSHLYTQRTDIDRLIEAMRQLL